MHLAVEQLMDVDGAQDINSVKFCCVGLQTTVEFHWRH